VRKQAVKSIDQPFVDAIVKDLYGWKDATI
jgi:hypothetical protein